MSIPTGWELVLLLGVLVLLFGATKLPTAARSIGQSMRIFKAETKGMRSEDEATSQPSRQQSPQQQPPQQQSPQQTLPASGPAATPPVEEPQRHNDTIR